MEQVQIAAKVTFLTTEQGGRKHPAWNSRKYRPHVVVGDPTRRQAETAEDGRTLTESYLGVCFDGDGEEMQQGTEHEVSLLLAYYPAVEYENLVQGATFTLREGGKIVGYGEVVESPFG
jgi:translation elongation factor EF-Tu-like GTPase